MEKFKKMVAIEPTKLLPDFYVALHDCITKDADFYSRGQSTFKKSKKGSRCYYSGDFRLIKLGNLYLYGVNWTSSTS